MIIAVVAIYLGLVIVVGVSGHRLFRGTGEDYFVASRSIGPFVLLMTLLGTNLTAFTMLGASGEAYRQGIVVFGLMGASSSILIPFCFYYLGTKSWWLGKRFSYVTQIQLIRDRYGSSALATGFPLERPGRFRHLLCSIHFVLPRFGFPVSRWGWLDALILPGLFMVPFWLN